MQVVEVDLHSRRQVAQFLDLPFWIYRDTPQWVPPLSGDARRMLSPRHPFYRHSQAAFFLAMDGERPVGRLAVLDNRNYNDYNHERRAFFYLFECINDLQVSGALFAAGFDWARRRGLTVVSGPKGFTALDGMGLLVQGFEHRPALGIPYNLAYYPMLIEAVGFAPAGDILSGCLERLDQFPEKIHAIAARVQERRGLHVAHFHRRSDLRKVLPGLRAMYNGAIQGTSGNVPLTDDEVNTIAAQLLWFADLRLIKIIMKGERAVGFLFAYPDISAAIQRTRGRLLPFGWIDVLRELRRTRWVDLNGAGIIDEYRGMGGTALLFSEMQKSIHAAGFEHVEVVQIGAENERMLRELKDLGVHFYKVHRMYERKLV